MLKDPRMRERERKSLGFSFKNFKIERDFESLFEVLELKISKF